MSLTAGVFVGLMVNYLAPISPDNEIAARRLLEEMDKINEELLYLSSKASFDYDANMTSFNAKKKVKYEINYLDKEMQDWNKLKNFKWKEFKDEYLKRQFFLISKNNENCPILETHMEFIPSEEELHTENNTSNDEFSNIHAKAKVCEYKNPTKCDLSLDPELIAIMKTSRDPKELEYYWKAWRDSTGKKMRRNFRKHVYSLNSEAWVKNFRNRVEQELDEFESDTIEQDLEDIWLNIEPLYKELHAYVRGKLNEFYGDEVMPKYAPIPSHILGSMTGFGWFNIFDITVPHPKKQSVDISDEIIKQGYTQLKMFESADDFFTSLNMSAVPESFWHNSILEKPKDGRNLSCHGAAWDLLNGKDFRILMCTELNMTGFLAAYHEMGHIQYFMQYKEQPLIFRRGANSGFEEAIGDVIALSASTPNHLQRLGLLPQNFIYDEETSTNYLLLQALDSIGGLPSYYVADKWRWDAYRGKSTPKDYNSNYWSLRLKYAGIQPPVERSEKDLDPGALHHVATDDPMISYFVSKVLQFQFYKALCIAAGEYDPKKPNENPLHNCDIYNNKEAGELLSKTLRLGASKPWPDALEMLTGTRKMSANDLIEYFKPIYDWLKKVNQNRGYKVGWEEPTVNCCVKS